MKYQKYDKVKYIRFLKANDWNQFDDHAIAYMLSPHGQRFENEQLKRSVLESPSLYWFKDYQRGNDMRRAIVFLPEETPFDIYQKFRVSEFLGVMEHFYQCRFYEIKIVIDADIYGPPSGDLIFEDQYPVDPDESPDHCSVWINCDRTGLDKAIAVLIASKFGLNAPIAPAFGVNGGAFSIEVCIKEEGNR
jgi:hypothetical protein